MAIVIPKLNRIEPSETMPDNNRINFKAQDQGSNILGRTQAVASVGGKVGDIYQQYENDTIETLSNVAEQEYTKWNTQALDKIKNYEGDPTDAYVEYDKQSKEKFDEILGSRPEVSTRVKDHVTSRMNKVYGSQNVAALKQRGAQVEIYKNNVFESTVKLKKDNLAINAGYIQKDDPSTFSMYDQEVLNTEELIVKRSLENGTAKELKDDEKGFNYSYKEPDEVVNGVLVEGRTVRVKMSPISQQRVAKELSEGISNSINVMITSGQLEEAKIMKEKYKNRIDPVNANKISNKLKDGTTKKEASNFLSTLGNRLSSSQRKELDTIEDSDVKLIKRQEMENQAIEDALSDNPELLNKTLLLKESLDNRLQKQQKVMQEKNYTVLADSVEKGINNGQINGLADLESDPIYAATWGKMSKEQRKSIHELIESPPTSNPLKLNQVNDLIMNGDIVKMSKPQFQLKLNGLSKIDKEKALLAFDAFGQQSDSSQRAANKRINKLIKNAMLQQKILKYDFSNKMTKGSLTKLNEANEYFMETVMSRGGKLNDAEIQKEVNSYVSRVKQDLKPLTPQGRQIPNVFNTSKPSANVINTPIVKKGFVVYPDGTIKLRDKSAQSVALNAYKAAGKSIVQSEPASVDAFKEWMRSEYLK